MGNESNNRVKGVTVVERSATQRVRVPKFYFPRINMNPTIAIPHTRYL